MDEAKKKYLEDLRKQINPDILSKMMSSVGDGGGNASSGKGGYTATSTLQDRRADRFQERIAKRKRESLLAEVHKKPEVKRWVLVLGQTGIWSRIAESQFRSFGMFTQGQQFAELPDLIKYLMAHQEDVGPRTHMIVVGYKDVVNFLSSWKSLHDADEQERLSFLKNVDFFCVVDSLQEVNCQIKVTLGEERIIWFNDEAPVNKMKVEKVLGIESSEGEDVSNE